MFSVKVIEKFYFFLLYKGAKMKIKQKIDIYFIIVNLMIFSFFYITYKAFTDKLYSALDDKVKILSESLLDEYTNMRSRDNFLTNLILQNNDLDKFLDAKSNKRDFETTLKNILKNYKNHNIENIYITNNIGKNVFSLYKLNHENSKNILIEKYRLAENNIFFVINYEDIFENSLASIGEDYKVSIYDYKNQVFVDFNKNLVKIFDVDQVKNKKKPISNKNAMYTSIKDDIKVVVNYKKSAGNSFYMLIISIVSFAILFIVLKIKMKQSILKPVERLTEHMKKLAEGDIKNIYEIRIPENPNKRNELDEVSVYYNKFLANFKTVLNKITHGADAIMESSKEINAANQSIAEKASVQANSLEKTSTEMEYIRKRVASNTKETNMANSLTEKTKNNTARAGVLSTGLKKSISAITESSKKIESIIDVINDIAFQTNLLALNAAVEAARAGEQGKGFAVVASEVRNLSQKTSLAAKQIKSHIKKSVERVDEGQILVDTTIAGLSKIVNEVKMVSDVINKIAISAEDQYNSIENVNRAIFELDEITQTNAGVSQETSAATTILYNQAKDFINMLKFFDSTLNFTEIKEKK